MEVDRVDGQRMLSGYGERLVEPLETDAEFRRPVTRVLKVGVVAGARARIDADPDRRAWARRPYRAIWLMASRLRWMPCVSSTSRSRSETFVPV